VKTTNGIWPLPVKLQSQSFAEAWELWSVGKAQRGALDACCKNDLGWRWHGVFYFKEGAKVS
jgi:hypothetical protein